MRKRSNRPEYDGLPTPRSTLRAEYVRVRLDCRGCFHTSTADLEKLIHAGRGDRPLVNLRWRCADCGSRRIDAMVVPKQMGVWGQLRH